MKTKNFLHALLMMALLSSVSFISSCGSDDGDEMDPDGSDDEISLSFTLGGTSEEAIFNSGSSFLAVSDGEVTVLSTSGALESGRNYAIGITFTSTSTGTFTLTQGAGENDEFVDGLSLAIIDGQNSVTYNAQSVTLTVTGYTVVSLAETIVTGTFSGTLEDEDTQETISITNGSFVTGFKD